MPTPMMPPITIIVASNSPICRARCGVLSIEVGVSICGCAGSSNSGGCVNVWSLRFLPGCGSRDSRRTGRVRRSVEPLAHPLLPFGLRNLFLLELVEHLFEALAAQLPHL